MMMIAHKILLQVVSKTTGTSKTTARCGSRETSGKRNKGAASICTYLKGKLKSQYILLAIPAAGKVVSLFQINHKSKGILSNLLCDIVDIGFVPVVTSHLREKGKGNVLSQRRNLSIIHHNRLRTGPVAVFLTCSCHAPLTSLEIRLLVEATIIGGTKYGPFFCPQSGKTFVETL